MTGYYLPRPAECINGHSSSYYDVIYVSYRNVGHLRHLNELKELNDNIMLCHDHDN